MDLHAVTLFNHARESVFTKAGVVEVVGWVVNTYFRKSLNRFHLTTFSQNVSAAGSKVVAFDKMFEFGEGSIREMKFKVKVRVFQFLGLKGGFKIELMYRHLLTFG